MRRWPDALRAVMGLRTRGVEPPITPALRRKLRLALVAMLSFSLAMGALFGKRGWLAVVRHENHLARLQAEIAELEEEIRRLEVTVASLKEDPVALERIAREELSLGRPGERLVFLDGPRRDPRRLPGWIGPNAPTPPAQAMVPTSVTSDPRPDGKPTRP